jgi:hypothetical protein
METQLSGPTDLVRLLERANEIQHAMRRPGGIRITVERELYAIREQLRRFALAARARPLTHAGGAGPRGPHAPQS